jgi:hypothetical protein
MASSPVSPQLEHLGDRPFSFYPPIVGVEHNEWTFREANWSEILVRNVKSADEIWIPRAYVGDVSKVDEPVMIVGLKRELEYRGGLLSPLTRRVLTMPGNPVAAVPRVGGDEPKDESGLSMRAALRSDGGAEGRVGKMIGIALLAGLIVTVVGIAILRLRSTGGTIEYKGVMQIDLGLTAQSDYFDVVRKLGRPAEDHWRADTGERQYRALAYPKNDIIIILMGQDRENAFYIGAKDSHWRTVHAVTLPGGKLNTEAILRTLPKF